MMNDEKIAWIFDVHRQTMAIYLDGEWTAVEKSKLNRLQNQIYAATATEIVEVLNSPATSSLHLEEAIPYIKEFNKKWTERQCREEKISYARQEDCIRFSSRSKKYSWLSNFFPSIIVDTRMQRAVITVESAYVAFKIQSFDISEGQPAMDDVERQTLISEVIGCQNSSRCKELGSSFIRNGDIQNKMAVIEMRRLVNLKFSQNEKLQDMLIRTRGRILEEHTGDPFWGISFGAFEDPEDNSNHLGKILMSLREEFSF